MGALLIAKYIWDRIEDIIMAVIRSDLWLLQEGFSISDYARVLQRNFKSSTIDNYHKKIWQSYFYACMQLKLYIGMYNT